MSASTNSAHHDDLWSDFGNHYIAVNEEGRLRSKLPLWQPGRPFHEAYQGPIDAGIDNGHIVFFIHGGLNDLPAVIARIKRFANNEVDGFKGEPWHLIHLAWDTSWGSAIDDVIKRLTTLRSLTNIKRLFGLLLPWNWLRLLDRLRRPVSHFGGIIWKSQYDTAIAATSEPSPQGLDRDSGFFRAFEYLDRRVASGSEVRISFVVHSAGAIVCNYLLSRISERFPNLSSKVHDYILLAPACHIAHIQEALGATSPAGQTTVLTLTPQLELDDDIVVYDKSLLWAIYDLFESGWREGDYRNFGLPFNSGLGLDSIQNRGLLGIEKQIADLESNPSSSFSRSLNVGAAWAETDADTTLGSFPQRVWTTAKTHGKFDDNSVTLESVKVLLA